MNNELKVHRLKTLQPYFDDVASGKKNFELRKNDRGFKVGDRLDLFEGDEQVDDLDSRVNKNHIHRYVSYVLHGGQYGLSDEYVILGLSTELQSRPVGDVEGYLEGKCVRKPVKGGSMMFVDRGNAIYALQALARDKDAEILICNEEVERLQAENERLTAEVERLKGENKELLF